MLRTLLQSLPEARFIRDRARADAASKVTLFAICCSIPWGHAADIATRSTSISFDELKQRVVFAIENRGLIVNHTAHVADMLSRTARDLGAAHSIYESGEVIEFCSATVSRAMMEADPHYMAYCPYTIAVYVLTSEPHRTYVSHRMIGVTQPPAPSQLSLSAVDRLLSEIVDEALR